MLSRLKDYYYDLLSHYIRIFTSEGDTLVEVDSISGEPQRRLPGLRSVLLGRLASSITAERDPSREISVEELRKKKPEGLLLLGNIHFDSDIQGLLEGLRELCGPSTRIFITYYSSLWRPLFSLASKLGLRRASREVNWISHGDMVNFCRLTGLEIVNTESRVLAPVRIPWLSDFCNRYVAPLPLFRSFCMLNIAVARLPQKPLAESSASIVVPARNEEGNIEEILRRLPAMGPADEVIFIEGGSQDRTWAKIQEVQEKWRGRVRIKSAQQDGKGKADAVRKGFAMAENDVLMILDADMTVPPEDLPKFFEALTSGAGEFVNGSRLVYPMEEEAMRFFNILGNKFFAMCFSFLLGQRFKDTLCGTKVITRENYLKLAANRSYFGEFDPFGDFDLLFGAARLRLSILDLPIRYRSRTYGETNIDRWRHGVILLKMVLFAARKIKFI